MMYLCFCVYDEVEFLEKHILAAKKAAPYAQVVVVDGAYVDFPHKHCSSTDGTLEVADNLADHVITCTEPWKSIEEKRSRYFIGNNGDEYLVVDADEELVGVVPMDIELTDARCEIRCDDGRKYSVFRYHKHFGSMFYFGQHNALWRDGVYVFPGVNTLHGCCLNHRNQSVPGERMLAKQHFRRVLAEREAEFRELERSIRSLSRNGVDVRLDDLERLRLQSGLRLGRMVCQV